jgi:hypothetical protein
LKKFWWGHKSAFGLKNTPEIELDPQIIENNVSIVSEFYKSIQAEIQLNVDEKYASPTNGFVPINLGVTMDGIGGIKIYNELSVASRFLPPRYPENLHFIIRGVHHKLSNSDWETSVETTSIANSDNNGSHYMQYDKLLAEVKKILGETNEQVIGAATVNNNIAQKGKGIALKLMNDLGINKIQASAIVGNLIAESNLSPSIAQGGITGQRLIVNGITGYGYAQWTLRERQQNLYNFAKSSGISPNLVPLTDQINYSFLVKELKGEYPRVVSSSILKTLKTISDLSNATKHILTKYEMPFDQGPNSLAKRTKYAQSVLDLIP